MPDAANPAPVHWIDETCRAPWSGNPYWCLTHQREHDPAVVARPRPSLAVELERAIDAENAAYMADPAAQADAHATGERWAAWAAAERAAGPHAVVVPVATMRDVLAWLRGEDAPGPWPRESIIASLSAKLAAVEAQNLRPLPGAES